MWVRTKEGHNESLPKENIWTRKKKETIKDSGRTICIGNIKLSRMPTSKKCVAGWMIDIYIIYNNSMSDYSKLGWGPYLSKGNACLHCIFNI